MVVRPTSLKILNIDWKVQWISAESDSGTNKFGWCVVAQQVIFIHEMKSAQKIADTFLHELLHAICWTFNLEDGMKEEEACARISTGLATVWRDNPDAFRWLSEQICSSCILEYMEQSRESAKIAA